MKLVALFTTVVANIGVVTVVRSIVVRIVMILQVIATVCIITAVTAIIAAIVVVLMIDDPILCTHA